MHDLVRTGDADSFAAIQDRNGEVVLAYCRRCGKGEGELTADNCIGVTADTITDADIRVFRDESRACGDRERTRAANAALGLPTGDGALGLLDVATCRARVAEIIIRERTPGTSSAGASK